eukprot:scaffold2149_cov187-Cylindrotheca_fusiformis.AAC.22
MNIASTVPDLKTEDDDAIDISLIMMNEAAMKMLDAEMDEVAELASRKSPSSVSASSSVFDEGERQEDKVEHEKEGSIFQFESKSLVEEQVKEGVGHDDDDSFMEELSALNQVSKKIEEELRDETADSMTKAMQNILNPPPTKNSRTKLPSDDSEHIDRNFDEETKKTLPSNKVESIMWSIQQQGLSAPETTYVLATLCVVVWTAAFGLMQKVMYADI